MFASEQQHVPLDNSDHQQMALRPCQAAADQVSIPQKQLGVALHAWHSQQLLPSRGQLVDLEHHAEMPQAQHAGCAPWQQYCCLGQAQHPLLPLQMAVDLPREHGMLLQICTACF